MLSAAREEEKLEDYDCLAAYKFADQSIDWVPCKIVSRTLRKDLTNLKHVSFNASCFEYYVAFFHMKQEKDTLSKPNNVFRRDSENILFSARYIREVQRTFKFECIKYIH